MKRKGVLCFIKKDQQVLLGQFDYGNGKIFWNGISGFIESGEKSEDALLREVNEEIGVRIDKKSLEYKGKYSVSDELELEIFIALRWDGVPEPQEKTLNKLQWFAIDNLPFDEMFPGNKEWVMELIK